MSRMYNKRSWRVRTVGRIRRRGGGQFDETGKYCGGAKCDRCEGVDPMRRSKNGVLCSAFDVAHLVIKDDKPGHDADENLGLLCRPCHRKEDYPDWASKFAAWLVAEKERRIDAADAARQVLAAADYLVFPMEVPGRGQ